MTRTLTGRTRFNLHKRWFGTDLVTLQVEETESGREHWSNEGGRVESDTLPDSTYFRDATIFDIQTLNLCSNN